MSWFHAKEGWMFTREKSGSSVTIKKLTNDQARKEEQYVSFDADTWASIVASVSAQGETGETFRAARAFHDRVVPPTVAEVVETYGLATEVGTAAIGDRVEGSTSPMSPTDEKVAEDLHERVTVRTTAVGQYLRVELVRERPWANGEDMVQAELLIEPGCKVTLGRSGLKVERLDG